ncbi:hypothetical protein GCM10023188_17330 [Pontibacter saemangeumensis]|uniref:Uncharacterized protein n=1 Tax=Pontibacter saemangeumensis TaxID=1084525 RepID=A0ABP8LK62_9BACT
MNSTENSTEMCAHCDVPTELHGAACGWENASWIMYPINQQQNKWSRKWIKAHPGSYPRFRNRNMPQNP